MDAKIKEYMPLADSIAKRMKIRLPKHVDFEDLKSCALCSLWEISKDFNPDNGINFTSYVNLLIGKRVIDRLRNTGLLGMTRRTTHYTFESLDQPVKDKSLCIEKSAKSFTSMTGWHAYPIDIGKAKIKEILTERLDDGVPDQRNIHPSIAIHKEEISKILADAIDQLPEKERLVISLYYYDELTLKEIGYIIDVNESWVWQIRARAIVHLREILEPIMEEV